MRNFAKVLVALCVAFALVAMVGCVDNGSYDDHEETLDLGDINGGEVTAPPQETEVDDAYVNAAPANEEPGWGDLIPRSN